MGLINWWLVLVALVAVVVLAVAFWRRTSPTPSPTGVLVVTATARATPRFRYLATRALRRSRLIVAGLVLVSLGAVLLAGRLSLASVTDSSQHNRDIMLCLDVSGSMAIIDGEIMANYATLATSLTGERIGLMVWDSSPVLKFPLTNDADYIAEQLKAGSQAMEKSSFAWFSGTGEGDGSSLIGDGLASCVLRFDRTDDDRARAIILATDNQVNGTGIYTLDQAIGLAKQRKIVVYGAHPQTYSGNDAIVELGKQVQRTGGRMYEIGHTGTGGDEVVRDIQNSEAARLQGLPTASVNDWRTPGLLLIVVGLALTLGAQGVRRQ